MGKLKIGIVGVGGIAQGRHIPAILKNPEKAELAAVSDLNLERAKDVAKKYDVPFADKDYNEIFKKVDAVVICTPNKFHSEITVAALEAGCHVLCEKPMAMDVAECQAMIDAAERAGKILAIAYHYRHTDAAKLAKATVDAGELGDVLVTRVEALRQRKVPGWGVFTNKDLQGGGSLIDYGCHVLDMALWLLGDPQPVEVMGRTFNRLSKIPGQINDWGTFDHETFNVDDHVTGYITFRDGSALSLECSWSANIKGDDMNLSLSGVDAGMNVYPFELYKPHHGTMLTSHADVTHDEDVAGDRQMVNFIESCLGESDQVVEPHQALAVNKIIAALYESSETGRSVRLD